MRKSDWVLVVDFVFFWGVCLSLPSIAMAGPGPCISGPNGTLTCSGDQSDGVSATAPTTTLTVNSLSKNISPSTSVAGLSLISQGINGDSYGIGWGSVVGVGPDGGNGGAAANLLKLDWAGNGYGISTQGNNANGIMAQSTGGSGGYGGWATGGILVLPAWGGDGGNGGNGGQVEVIANGNIYTLGTGAHGIIAESRGGRGNDGGWAFSATYAKGGNGGIGGSGNAVTVANHGAISTQGIEAHGIWARSLGGEGGDGGQGDGIYGDGGPALGSGPAGDIIVTNYGSITTSSTKSRGILLQSIGGFSGDAGGAAGLVSFGGSVNSAGDGGQVTLTNSGAITTSGESSDAIYAQSAGGGGGADHGEGGWSEGLFTKGGSGTAGGDAKKVEINNQATLHTSGLNSKGIYAQSLGGGGGSGGGSVSVSAFLGGSLGGSGGTGGAGGEVKVTSSTLPNEKIETKGANADGIFAQSAGGGGGEAGYAITLTGGYKASVSFAMGGSGGLGGAGGIVTVNNASSIRTEGNDAYGIYAESLGGGGGKGGFSIAGAGTDGIGVAVSIGGSGGHGGSGDTVTVNSSGATIETKGDRSTGIFAQSAGKGGGAGGFSISATGAGSGSVSFSMGGSGAGGGNGKAVNVTSDSSITTQGNSAKGIIAQSMGGGGGAGGFSISGGVSTDNNFNISLGGSGGSGASSGNVLVLSSHSITSHGDDADGIFAQSQGGGGGVGGFSVAGGVSLKGVPFNVSFGGAGGTGGSAGSVAVGSEKSYISGAIATAGERANGIMALSQGGNGGSGGFSVSGGISLDNMDISFSSGGAGGAGGIGGPVNVFSKSVISTEADNARSIIAKSQGGNGGDAGFSVAGGITTHGGINVSLGGSGGGGGQAGDVSIHNNGALMTLGKNASGIEATSISGNGGNGGFSVAGTIDFRNPQTNIEVSVGGGGGSGGLGGVVGVTNNGVINTAGESAPGIKAQSIGGNGGNGGFSAAGAFAAGSATPDVSTFNLGVSVGGGGGNGNVGGAVEVVNNNLVNTNGKGSHGVFAESVGGGGGTGGNSLTAFLDIASANKGKHVNINVSVGGKGGDGNNGGAVTVTNQGQIETGGYEAHGIYAQSTGGGGGDGGSASSFSLILDKNVTFLLCPQKICSQKAQNQNNFSVNVAVGGWGGGASDGGTVVVSNSKDILTRGAGSNGIFAQSVGGGGGNGGNATLGLADMGLPETAEKVISGGAALGGALFSQVKYYNDWQVIVGGSGGSSGNGGAVTVTNSGNITTLGNAVTLEDGQLKELPAEGGYGILAQSVGGGGGTAIARGGNATVGLTGKFGLGGAAGSSGDGGVVGLSNSGQINTSGIGAHAIVAQSVGGGGGIAGDVNSFPVPFTDTSVGLNLALSLDGGNAGNGGSVTITNSGKITTAGAGAFGILAQSIGGGGGIAGKPGFLGIQLGTFFGTVGGIGSAGAVTVNQSGDITTSGDGANGIFAQSAGGKKGEGSKAVYQGLGGNVSVTLQGNITVGGKDGHGILAQSRGDEGRGNISIDIQGGTVQGGSGAGTGVRFLDGANNTLTNRGTITTVDGIAGIAIFGTIGNEAISNLGTVNGKVNLGAGANSFINQVQAQFNSGTTVNLGTGNTLTNAGTLSPGGAGTIMTTGLTGILAQSGTGTLAIDMDSANGTTDRLNTSGSANVAGFAAVTPVNTGFTTPGNRQSIILLATEGVTDSGIELSAPKSAVIAYDLLFPNSTQVVLGSNISFAPAGLRGPQLVVGDYINRVQLAGGSVSLAPFISEIVSLPELNDLAHAYEHLSPDSYAGATAAAAQTSLQYMRTLGSRMQGIRAHGMNSGSTLHSDIQSDRTVLLAYNGSDASIAELFDIGKRKEAPERYGVWIDGFGRWGDQGADPGFTGFNYSVAGGALGLDFLLGERVIVGVSGGYSYTSIDLDDNKGDGNTRSSFGAIYGSYFTRKFYLETALSYARQNYRNVRNIVVGALESQARSKHNGDTYSASLGGGYNIAIERWLLQPLAALRYIYLAEDSFRESGAGGVNLIVGDRSTESLESELGFRLARIFPTGIGAIIPEVRAAWVYDFGLDDRVITSAFEGSPNTTFAITGQDVNKHGAILGAGITLVQKNGFSTTLKYDTELREDYSSHGLFGEIRYSF